MLKFVFKPDVTIGEYASDFKEHLFGVFLLIVLALHSYEPLANLPLVGCYISKVQIYFTM